MLGCSNLSAAFSSPATPVTGADRYAEISFAAGAGSLAAGANTGEIQLRINLADWSALNENDDYSYIGTQTSYALTDRITLYRGGVLVWGTEPAGGAVTPTVPAAPAGLGATAGDAQAALTWSASSGAASYNVKRATTSGGPYATVATGVNATSYSDTGLTNGTTYYYVVSAVNAAGQSANSAQASATPTAPVTPTVPSAPTGLAATAGDAQATLTWSASSGATSYNVKRATTSGGPYATVATGVTATSYADTGLTNGTTYYYVVSAANAAGESLNSAQASATPTASVTPSSSLVVQYRTTNSSAADNQIYAQFNIKNNGTSAVSLSGLKLRYYFTKDSAASLNSWVDYAVVGSSNVSGSFGSANSAANGADTYLELSFGAGAGAIAAGGQSGDIQVRVAKTDWTNFNEVGDYSYDPTKTSFADWSKVTLYQGGSLVWGTEP
ncbi:hypothetical protein ELR57_08525 [Cohnella sp. AR92]|nr:hypothetical protein ELR57_08525 [Cohnella sp. AR92]